MHEAEALVLAVPLNCLPGIAFEPALPPGVAEAAGANAGRAVKVLMLVRGVAPHGIAVGIGPGLNWLYADTAERWLRAGDRLRLAGRPLRPGGDGGTSSAPSAPSTPMPSSWTGRSTTGSPTRPRAAPG